MALSACLPLAADRYGACVRTVIIRGLDLTGVTMRAQVRLRPDTPGDPLIDLNGGVAANAEGLTLVSAAPGDDGVMVSTVQIRINETTMEGLPYAGEIGDASTFAWDWQATIGGDKRRLAYGNFIVLPGVTGADNAPTDREVSYAPISAATTWSTAQLNFGPETVTIAIDGADFTSALVTEAKAAADRAEAAADPAARAAQIASFYDAPPFRPDGSAIFAAEAVDDDGYVGYGLNEKGELVANLSDSTRGYIEVIAPFVAGYADEDGYVASPIGADGEPVTDPTNDGFSFTAFDTGASPAREAAVIDAANNVALLTYGEGDSHATRQDGATVTFVTEDAGDITYRTADVSLKPAFTSDAARLVHFIGFGQSNSLGFHANPGLDMTPLDPARAFQFPGSITPGEADDHTYLITDDRLGLLEPLSGPDRVGRGALGPRIVHRALPQLASTDAALWSGHGVAGQSYANLRVGTPPWHNLRRGMVRGALQAWRAGLSYTIPAMVYVQGEDNYGSTKADYLADLNELHDQFQSDARVITRDSALETPILLAQTTSWTKYSGLATSDVPRAEMQAMLDHPDRFAVFMAMYSLAYDEGIHLTSAGARLLDEYAGRAMATVLAGGDAAGLYPVAATRVGTSLAIDCHVPTGPLAIDTSLVSDPGQYGLVYLDTGGDPVALSSIAVSGTQITATLASAVAGTLRFALDGTIGNAAGPTTGARCCIRDSAADVSAGGVTMRNYMLCSEIAVA